VKYASLIVSGVLLPAVCDGVGQLSVKRHGRGWRRCVQLPYHTVANLMVAGVTHSVRGSKFFPPCLGSCGLTSMYRCHDTLSLSQLLSTSARGVTCFILTNCNCFILALLHYSIRNTPHGE
jgi:hypothetical protein